MFTATLVRSYPAFVGAALTKGKIYEVIDFNDWNGTYIILDDNGARKSVDWLRFADQGKAACEYQRRRDAEGRA